MRTVRLLATLLFLSGLSGIAALAQQDQTQSATGDPVADAARKARQEKKSAPKPKKVFTDDDVAGRVEEFASKVPEARVVIHDQRRRWHNRNRPTPRAAQRPGFP